MVPVITVKKVDNGYIVTAEYQDKAGNNMVKNHIMQNQKEVIDFLKQWLDWVAA